MRRFVVAVLAVQARAQSLKDLLSQQFEDSDLPAAPRPPTDPVSEWPTRHRRREKQPRSLDRQSVALASSSGGARHAPDPRSAPRDSWRSPSITRVEETALLPAATETTLAERKQRRRRRRLITPAPVAADLPTPRPTVSAAERKSAATKRCAASARRPIVDAGALEVLLVVPGLLDASRVDIARRYWAALRPRACVVPTWQRCGDDPDLDEAIDGPIKEAIDGPRLPYLGEACDVPRVPTGRKGYVSQLKFILPAHVQALGVKWVFVVLDDVRLAGEFDAAAFFRIATHNGLDVASPAIRRAHGHRFPEMRPQQLTNGAVGRRVAKVELFATAFSAEAYRCFHDLADVALNAQGYGYPDWLPGYCALRGEKFAAGVLDACVASHGVPGTGDAWTKSYDGRKASKARRAMAEWYKTRGVELVQTTRNVTGFLYDEERPSS